MVATTEQMLSGGLVAEGATRLLLTVIKLLGELALGDEDRRIVPLVRLALNVEKNAGLLYICVCVAW